MALQSSGPISNGDVQGEFGGSNPASLSEYYSAATGVPSSGNPISLSDFYGTSNVVSFSFVIQGAGGAGGWGLADGGSGTAADPGGSTSVSGSGMTTVSVAGGAGGTNAISLWYDESDRDGHASFYGAGGAGGASNAASPGQDAPSSHYGAGGGGGGSDKDEPEKLDNDGAGGTGGRAGTRNTGTATVPQGTTITITVGSGGVGTQVSGSQGRAGGSGADGIAFITYNGVTTTYNAGTHTQTLS